MALKPITVSTTIDEFKVGQKLKCILEVSNLSGDIIYKQDRIYTIVKVGTGRRYIRLNSEDWVKGTDINLAYGILLNPGYCSESIRKVFVRDTTGIRGIL